MASLAAALLRSDTLYLRQLAEAWGIPATDSSTPISVPALINRMTDRYCLRSKLEEMSETEREVLFLLAGSFEHQLGFAELTRRCRKTGADVVHALESLSKLGLLLVEERESRPPSNQLKHQIPVLQDRTIILPTELLQPVAATQYAMQEGDDSLVPLRAHLQTLNVRALQNLAREWSIPRPYEYAKQFLIEELLTAMSDGYRVWTTAKACQPGAEDLLALLMDKGGRAPVAWLKEITGEEQLRLRYDALRRLSLVQEAYIDECWFLFIPVEIRVSLDSSHGADKDLLLLPVKPEGVHQDNQLSFVEDIITLISFVDNSPIELTASGQIYKRTLSRLNSYLCAQHIEADEDHRSSRLSFLLTTGRKLGLFRDQEGRLVAGESAEGWLRLSIAEKVRSMRDDWIAGRRFEVPYGLEYLGTNVSWPTARRNVLRALVSICKVGAWYDIKSFADFVVATEPEIMGSDAAKWVLKRIVYIHKSDIDRELAAFVYNVVAYPLTWFGFVALAKTASAPPALCFSITPLGAWALGATGGQPPPEPGDQPLIVQPNFEIVSAQAGGIILRRLARFANLMQSDKARVYTLTKESVLRGIDSGMTSQEMVDFLSQYTLKEVPQNVAYSITDWARQHRPISFATVALVEVESEDILSELLASTKFARYFLRRISPTTAVLDPKADLKNLFNELRKRGYSPRISKT